MPRFIGIIPARFASTRFPGKPLVMINGVAMIERVYRQALQCGQLSEVAIATDDERIAEKAKSFGANVIMTGSHHPSGTDRCAEAAKELKVAFDDIIVNIQGDEPFINPKQIEQLCGAFTSTEVKIATLIKRANSIEQINNPNSPKVVIDQHQFVLYFSRLPIPFQQNKETKWLVNNYFTHIGLYAYRAETLFEITRLAPSFLEKMESLEQLRWLENAYRIKAVETEYETLAVDTPEDLLKFS
jgi:3-deoxy-manno-octulosonate cytidylyltransferase (CMP-KDO synthetase)